MKRQVFETKDGSIEYIIDKENQIIDCRITLEIDDTLKKRIMNKLPNAKNHFNNAPELEINNKNIQWTFVGRAVCDPDDTFSIKKGKQIAYKEARNEIHSYRMETYWNLIHDLNMKMNAVYDLMDEEKESLAKLKKRLWEKK